ncbi:MAG: hypothetical protein P9L92_13540 [Candidatus Electryonea clarkiae]|nr:hypothetical protein [Candidatus Electryonea clarkiae]MDP8286122.1 hypothetical protein [Candidatus Electryonea clarkiae]
MIDKITPGKGPSEVAPKHIDKPPAAEELRPEDKSIRTDQTADDIARFSVDAEEISRYQELVRLHREAYGDEDRSEKLAAVKKRLEEGYYDSPEAEEALAGKMVEVSIGDAGRTADPETIKRRMEDNFYDKPAVVDKTAENMLRHVIPNQSRE